MSDHLLVEALRKRDPGATAAVYDAHADGLYAYCWFQLRDRDAAQVALRDTFIVAEAYIGKLRDPERFGPWLYAIARLECARRMPRRHQTPDVPVADPDQEDADRRIVAWRAVQALPLISREILELHVRHQMSVPDLAAVFGLSVTDAQAALDDAQDELEAALTVEILARNGPCGCDERALLLLERRDHPAHDISERLMEHAQGCPVCGALCPRSVSAAKVYGLLPVVAPAPEMRLRVMSCFLDPELVGYRLFVATRVTEFRSDGFPVQTTFGRRPGRVSRRGRRRRLGRSRKASKEDRAKEGEAEKAAAGFYAQAVRAAAVLVAVALLSAGGVASMYGVGAGREDAYRNARPHPTAVPGISQRPGSGRRSDAHSDASDLPRRHSRPSRVPHPPSSAGSVPGRPPSTVPSSPPPSESTAPTASRTASSGSGPTHGT